MAHDGCNGSTAARAVGYESPSQFGRESKRIFGVTPAEEAEQTRARLVAGGCSPSRLGFGGDPSPSLRHAPACRMPGA